MTNTVSRVSSTTVRKRTMARAPTREKARATLSPMTSAVMATKIVRSTRVVTNPPFTAAVRPRMRM